MDDQTKKACGAVDADATVEFVKTLLRAETVETEEPVVPVLERELKDMGMDVEVYETFNPRAPERKRPCLLGTLRGENPKPLLCFNGHTDVVPVEFPSKWRHPPFEPVVEGSRLYGRGSSDMKGGLGAMIMGVRALVESGTRLKGTLVVAAVPGEESGGWGTESMAGRGDWDAAVIGEPTGLVVCPACNGIASFTVQVTGRAAHASMPETGVNAIDKMLGILNEFEAYKERLSGRVHRYTGTPAFVSCILRGGWRGVIVADECSLHVTTHLIPGETAESRFSEVAEILERLRKEDPELKCEMVDWEGVPISLPLPRSGPRRARLDPTEISAGEPIVRAVLRGGAAALGREPRIGGVRYACDSPYFVNDRKVPTVVFGPGDIAQAHTDDEWIDVGELVAAAKAYAASALAFLGHA